MFRHPPDSIGDDLQDFADDGLTTALVDAICGKGNRYGENCSGECTATLGANDITVDCPGFVILGNLESQIGKAGVEFMKKLVKEWTSSNEEGEGSIEQ